jgi:hypothetical protein
MSHPPFYFFHEYLDEARRFRANKHIAETEPEARKLHRQAAEFRWVTQHNEPTISPLFGKGEHGYRAIAPGQRQGHPYTTQTIPTPMPDDVRALLGSYTRTNNPH